MTTNEHVKLDQFLEWVLREHGETVRNRCRDILFRHPDRDAFVVLDEVRYGAAAFSVPQDFGNLPYTS